MERLVLDRDPKGDTEAAPDIFLKAGRSGKALARMDDLREAAPAAVDAGPELAASFPILADAHHGGDERVPGKGKRGSDQTHELGQQPAGPAHPAFDDLACIDDDSAGYALPEARPHCLGQARPGPLANQGAEAE